MARAGEGPRRQRLQGRDDMTILTLELVPASSWGDNLRSRLRPGQWDRVRKRTYQQGRYRCEICGGKGTRHPVEAHEIWSYDDVNHVQRLVGMIALCPTCHMSKHIGRTLSVSAEHVQDRVLAHIMRVNHWSEDLLLRELESAFAVHAQRSQFEWTVDISFIDSWLEAQ